MARLTAGIATSHVPLIGVGVDQKKQDDPYFQPIFAGYDWTKEWIKKPENKPDVVILVFNDHASAFGQEAKSLNLRTKVGARARCPP